MDILSKPLTKVNHAREYAACRTAWYARLGAFEGIAREAGCATVNFTRDLDGKTRLIAKDHPALILAGLVAQADAQREADDARGGFAVLCCNGRGD